MMRRRQRISAGCRRIGALGLGLALLAAACGQEPPTEDVASAPSPTAVEDADDGDHGATEEHDSDDEHAASEDHDGDEHGASDDHGQPDAEDIDLPSDALAFDATPIGGGTFNAEDLRGRDVAIWFYMPG